MKHLGKVHPNLRRFIDWLAHEAKLDHPKIRVYVSVKVKFPEQVGGKITIPSPKVIGIEQFGKSLLHELQHAHDLLTGKLTDLSEDDAEKRARKAESLVSTDDIVQMAEFYQLTGDKKVGSIKHRGAVYVRSK